MLRIYSPVVVPTYRHSEFLEATLNDISQQTYVKTEIIIVIDGPDPESLKIAKQFQEKDERITVINKRKNSGVNNALPTGYENFRRVFSFCKLRRLDTARFF